MHIRVPEFCDIKWHKPLPLFEVLGIYCYNHPGRCELEIRYVKLKDNYRNQTYYVDGAGYEAESFHEWIKHEFFNWTDDFELLAKPEYAHLIHIKMMKDYMQPNKWRFEAGGYFYVD